MNSDQFEASLNEIAALPAGWYYGQGIALTTEQIQFVGTLLSNLVEAIEFEFPSLFPIPDGGIQAEWEIGSWSISLGFYVLDRRIICVAVDSITAESVESENQFDTPELGMSMHTFLTSCRDRASNNLGSSENHFETNLVQ